ncbi:MAG: putative rane protein [Myxococcales bacterium]|nr:putative rane protein [Myxococcales bacterium]
MAALALLVASGCAPQRDIDVGESISGLAVCPKGAVVQGVDVSHYQGVPDWQKAKAGGIDFAFMKATESTNFVDPQFATNWKSAGAAGVIRGAYHFFRASADATKQADYFIQTTGLPAAGDLPLTLDLEVLDGVTAAQATQGALTFLQRVEQKTGRKPIVYTSPSFYSSTLGAPAGFQSYVLWIANWQTQCPSIPGPAWSDWTFWQTSDKGTAAGVSGTLDVDEFNGSLADLQNFVNPTHVGQDGGVDMTPSGGADAGPTDDAGGSGGSGGTDGGGGSGGSGGTGGSGGGGGPNDAPGVAPTRTAGGCSLSTDATSSPSQLCLILLMLFVGSRITRQRRRPSPFACPPATHRD